MRIATAAVVLILALFALTARADDSSALISEALDKPVTLEVDGVLPQVVKKITDETAVPIEVPQRVYDLLPWGEQTNIQATIKGQTLRQALTALTHKLGLTWELTPQAVKITPRQPLDRLGRRATIQELELLDLLESTPLGSAPTDALNTPRRVVTAIDQKLAELKTPYTIEFRPGDRANEEAAINLPRNVTLNDALREIAKQTPLTWYPWGQNIVVIPKEDQIARQLDRTITKRYNRADVAAVLTDLAQAAGVELSFEPGALQRVPAEFRRIDLILDNARVREALENIRGVTGLDYVVKPTGLYFSNQNAPASASSAPPGGPIIATLTLDNGLQVFLRNSDIPPDVLEFIQKKKQQEFKRLRQQMSDEHFVPATQPTTRD